MPHNRIFVILDRGESSGGYLINKFDNTKFSYERNQIYFLPQDIEYESRFADGTVVFAIHFNLSLPSGVDIFAGWEKVRVGQIETDSIDFNKLITSRRISPLKYL